MKRKTMAQKKKGRSKSFREGLIAELREDSEFQAEYLKSSFEENSDMPEAILMALRDIA